MYTANGSRVRPQSAKYYSSSGKRNTSMHSQLKQDSRLVYTQSSKSRPIHTLSKMTAPELKRLLPNRTDMSPQRLFEENMALKKKLNEVTEQLRLEKMKGETVERKNAKWKKRLDVEFEKEMYWGQKGEYLVMGVKNQYEKVKKMYDEKCQENQIIKRDLKYSQLQEVKAELEVYKSETGRLRQELEKLVNIYEIPYQLKSEDDRENRLLAEQLKQAVEKLEYDIETYKSGIKRLDKLVKDRDQKIEFLEKLVIDKDNYSYQLEQKSKRLHHQNESIKAENKGLKVEMEEQKTSMGQKIQDIKASEERRLQRELNIYEDELQTKTQKITKLEAEIVYLSTLLAQWRPSENDPMRNSFENKIHQNKSMITQRKQSNVLSIIEVEEEVGMEKNANEMMSRSSLDHNMGNSSIMRKEKSTHYSLKRAVVKKEEIENICLEIKFRLFNEKIPINVAKSYIKAPIEGEEITIKNLIDIFSTQPFCMESQQRRILLARYLIEDGNQSTVYYDQQRSQSQAIVRSIFQQIIPKFTIPSQSQLENIKSKVSDMLTKYHITLSQVAMQYNRQLVFNQSKFIEILDEQELNLGREYNDYMVSHMLKSSPDITQLNFKALMTLVVKKEN